MVTYGETSLGALVLWWLDGPQAMEEDFHPSYDCSDCAKKAAENGSPENGNAKKHKMFLGRSWKHRDGGFQSLDGSSLGENDS